MRLEEGHLGMVILYPMFFQSVIHLSGGWIVVLIVANMTPYAISSSLTLVIHDNMINGTNHIV
jgi:hypothetical protein